MLEAVTLTRSNFGCLGRLGFGAWQELCAGVLRGQVAMRL